MRHVYLLDSELWRPPATLVKAFRVEARTDDGLWKTLHHEADNYQRLVRIPLACNTTAIRLVCESTWGSPDAHLYGFELRG